MADYDQAISLDPKLAEAYNNRRAARADQGDLASAMADYVKLNPNLADAYYGRGWHASARET